MLNPNTSPTVAISNPAPQAGEHNSDTNYPQMNPIAPSQSAKQGNDTAQAGHTADNNTQSSDSPKPSYNQDAVISVAQLSNIANTLAVYQDSVQDVAGVLSVLNYNKHLNPYQIKAILSVLQAYCECTLTELAEPELTAIDKLLKAHS